MRITSARWHSPDGQACFSLSVTPPMAVGGWLTGSDSDARRALTAPCTKPCAERGATEADVAAGVAAGVAADVASGRGSPDWALAASAPAAGRRLAGEAGGEAAAAACVMHTSPMSFLTKAQ